MNYINEEYVEKYILSILPENEGYLKELEEYAKDFNIPIVDREVAQLLKVLLKIIKPKNIRNWNSYWIFCLIMASSTDDICKITTIERRLDMVELAEKTLTTQNIKIK